MILRSLGVSGWRSLVSEVSVGPFTEGLNVIHGPNGTGKSTLFEALCRGLLDSHNVGGQDVQSIQPWGRPLSPRVVVEFAHDGTEYRIAKQFLDDASSELERKESGKFTPLAAGREADRIVRETLSGEAPGRGLSNEKHWGWAQVLWASQGDIELPGLSGDLVSDIRNALGVQTADRKTGPIEEKIEEAYLAFFTPTGRLKTGAGAPEIVRLENQLEEARTQSREASELLSQYEDASRRVEDLRARREQSRLDAEELTQAIARARKGADAYRALESSARSKREAAETAKAQYERLDQHVRLIEQMEKDLAECRNELRRLEDDASARESALSEREKALARAKAAVEDARRGRQEAEASDRLADEARAYVSCAGAVRDLEKKLKRAENALTRLREAEEERAKVVAPDRKTLTAIRKAIRQRDEARTLLDASLITLEIVPEEDRTVRLVAGEETGERDIPAGRTARFKGSPEVVADLEGVARIRATGPTGDIEDHRAQFDRAQEALEKRTKPYGTSDLEELEELAARAADLDKAVGDASTQLEAILDGTELEDLRRQLAGRAQELEKHERERPEWRDSPPDLDALEAAARELRRKHDDAIADAEAEYDRLQAAHSEARNEDSRVQTRLDEARKRETRLDGDLAELTRDGKTKENREKERSEQAIAWEAAKTGLGELEAQLESYEDDPVLAIEKLEKQLSAADDAARAARDDEKTAEGRLESIAARGPYTALADAEERAARLTEDVRRERTRVDAVRLLYETLRDCRAEAVAAVVEPVERAATRIVQRVAGRRIGSVCLGKGFTPSAVSPEMAEESVGVESLSGGETEQLYLATRLALAQVLAEESRQMVLLDDVLTATDAGRLARVLAVLEEAAQKLQIVILTCHPERYRALEDAAFFDLEAIIGE